MKNNCRYPLISLIVPFIILIIGCKQQQEGIVTDIDGNVYHTVRIGTQVWMVENLKVTRYQNGDLIPDVKDTAQWRYLPIGTYCSYNNEIQNTAVYGRLYNWYAVTDKRNIAPKGWHVPSFSEIELLIANLGGDTVAAGRMKEAGNSHWLYPNTGAGAQNSLIALPGGYRHSNDGSFHTMGSNGYWWTTTQSYEMYAWSRRVYSYFANAMNVHDYKSFGFSVRCVKD